ncbi:hypothetical protein SAMN05216319_1122 [Duganella sp. CF402]|uniref:hypothetical protein n=1 Tax=unclassified Duganella TaxID=2636909 RepID=UPI0008B0A1F9|nr:MULTISPECIES: hypothetical protein [unclassified Duganella]RZT10420.1 hypothetical protein EV582_2503 [Duganella sp. BK701]SEL13870.1 hypothetical protein SAMN05216319_1122 [Duganella sp. CF402]
MKALLVLLAVSGSAWANDADLLRCRAISDISSRVACYDAIPLAATPAATSAATPAPAAVKPAPAATFGLTATQMRKPEEPNFIESTLLGRIDGWSGSTLFRLANGQIWRVSDDSSGSVTEIDNPKIKITRNSLGTMFLEIEGANQAPRVRRIQ